MIVTYTFEGLASAYNVADVDGDIIEQGAFNHFQSRRIPLKWAHDFYLRGHGEVTGTTEGLAIRGRFEVDDDCDRDAAVITALHLGARALSIGYRLTTDLPRPWRIYRVSNLAEVSLCISGANPAARIFKLWRTLK